MNSDMRKLVQEGYEKGDYAGVYRTQAGLNTLEQRLFDALLGRIPPGARVLDLGCGSGLPYDRYMVDRGYALTGIDITQKHLDAAVRNVPEAAYIKGDFTTVELPSGGFDAIVCLYAMFHIPRVEHASLFRRMYRLLRTGGMILVTLGTSNSEYGEEADWCGARMAWSTYDPPTYQNMMAESNFAIVESAFEGQPGDEEYHFWVLAEAR